MKPFLLMGAGKVHLDILDPETFEPNGLQMKGNCTKLNIKPDSEIIEEFGASDEDLFQTIGSVAVPKPASGSAEFNQFDQELFAAIFMGTNSLLEQEKGEVKDRVITVKHDRMFELGKYKISDFVAKDENASKTYEPEKDYMIRPRVGGFVPNSSGAIPADSKVKLSYKWPVIEGTVMSGMTRSNVVARILWEGRNMDDGREFILDIFRARLASSGDFNFQNAIEKKFIRAGFNFSMETPPGKMAPFKLLWLN